MIKKTIFDEKQMAEKSIFKSCGKFIDFDGEGVKNFVVEKGKGKNIIFINGIAACVYTWRAVLDILSREFHVFGVDFKGTGFSDKPEGEYSINVFTNQLVGLMKYFNMDKAVLVGNSLGGEVALDFAVKYPEKVSKLVLIDSAGYMKNKKMMRILVRLSRYKVISSILKKCITRNFIKKIAQWAVFDDKIVDVKMVDSYYKTMNTKGGFSAFIELVKNLSYTEFNYEQVKNIKSSTLIIWGKEDKWIPVSDAFRLHQDIKNSKLVILNDCGHGPQEEKPEKVAELIRDFINDKLNDGKSGKDIFYN
ncbi:alpha/beta hydrolase [Clostridium sp. SYSU_GA19001]|uniref:alpha/beta fold hydrolase n=1 Tax=Clostridium caldaquaticum TaxID=2940653 RepID=UPI002077590E|nr:alpha/beta hydrolase [Clostridium caldaquaticum]MCM8711485.1 alpha/beta hydrolase [Clostridium caldaquaticum]